MPQKPDVVFVTPSHQFPTTVTMPLERRMELLKLASERDFIIIEDDYEFETNYVNEPCPALKSLDDEGRVIYVGSLSKTFFPGLRLGFLVGPEKLVEEARALRRLMVRHAPNNNQRTAALFLSLGHHDMLIRRLHRAYRARWEILGSALQPTPAQFDEHSELRRHKLLGEGAGLARQRTPRGGLRGPKPVDRTGANLFRSREQAAKLFPARLLLDRGTEDRTRHQTSRRDDRSI